MGLGHIIPVVCLIIVSEVTCTEVENSRVVLTDQGPVRGYRDPNFDLYVFFDLPYATAPSGKDRFKAPLPPPIWTETREAVDRGIICPQIQYDNNKTMSPDCLVANVYVPVTNETGLPVMVMVHGGGFFAGWGTNQTPKNLVKTKKLIVVNFNYRLSGYGFLCLGTTAAPGNAGLKDQVALLRWVQRNIAAFGGNPSDVTLEGCSAGGSSIDLLLLSKSTEGLFNKVIPSSGGHIAPFTVQIDPIENAKYYAKKLGFNEVDDLNALEEFYINLPMETLVKETFAYMLDGNLVFSPCVENDVGEEMFLDNAPMNILNDGNFTKVPTLYGYSNMEGLYSVMYRDFHALVKAMNENFSDVLPQDLQFNNTTEKEEVGRRVKEFYFGDKSVGVDTILQFIDYYSDSYFAFAMLNSVKLQVATGHDQIYLYEYSFSEGYVSIPEGIEAMVQGAGHCDQTAIVYDERDEELASADKKQMKAIMREIWLNFVLNGKPDPPGSTIPTWPATGSRASPLMALTLLPKLADQALPKTAKFWTDIYSRHYLTPAPPTPAVDTTTEYIATTTPNGSNTMYKLTNYYCLLGFLLYFGFLW